MFDTVRLRMSSAKVMHHLSRRSNPALPPAINMGSSHHVNLNLHLINTSEFFDQKWKIRLQQLQP